VTRCNQALAAITLLWVAVPARCQSSPFSARIRVGVTAEPLLEDQLRSCLTKELRSLPGVVVADENPRFSAAAIALRFNSGIAVSLIIYASPRFLRRHGNQGSLFTTPYTWTAIFAASATASSPISISTRSSITRSSWRENGGNRILTPMPQHKSSGSPSTTSWPDGNERRD
jgi:hypothetical protein